MKSKILLLIAMTISQYTFGQINKGAILVEGTLNYSQNKSETEYYTNANLTSFENHSINCLFRPKVGYFIGKTFLVGLGFEYDYNTYESEPSNGSPGNSYSNESNLYLIGPYISKYFKLNEKLFFNASLSAYWGSGNTRYTDSFDEEAKSDILAIRSNLIPGVTYFLSVKWAVTANFGQLYYNYSESTLTTDNGADEKPVNVDNNFGASFAFNTFGVGVQYLLHNKTE